MILSEVQTSGNRLVPDLGCIADVSEPPNPSGQFSVWFDEPYEGKRDPAERLHLVEAHQLCWNPPGRLFTEFEMFTNNLLRRNDTRAQFSCSPMYLSSRTPLMLAVIAVRGTPM